MNARRSAFQIGRVIRNRVPASLLLTSIRPSWATTIFLTIARPRPEPCGLVVKNGVKIRSVRSLGTPGPLSATSTMTIGVDAGFSPTTVGSSSRAPTEAVMAIAPRPSIASNALVSRFVNT